MMNASYADTQIAVYDDFLPSSARDPLLGYFDRAPFRKILPGTWGRAYRLDGGDALVGQEFLSHQRSTVCDSVAYPTETPLDILIARLLEFHSELEHIVGAREQAWNYFTVCPYVYPAGSSLGWHSDLHSAGAYVYYAHSAWNIHWGGELLVGRSDRGCEPYSTSSRGIFRNDALESVLRAGIGEYFAPLPNRLILLRGGTAHMIRRVELAAGDNLRLSVSGFFLKDSFHRARV